MEKSILDSEKLVGRLMRDLGWKYELAESLVSDLEMLPVFQFTEAVKRQLPARVQGVFEDLTEDQVFVVLDSDFEILRVVGDAIMASPNLLATARVLWKALVVFREQRVGLRGPMAGIIRLLHETDVEMTIDQIHREVEAKGYQVTPNEVREMLQRLGTVEYGGRTIPFIRASTAGFRLADGI